MDNRTLFNCCTNAAEPDWSQFNWLELGGCVDVSDPYEDETCIEGGYRADEAEFFTVYGHLKGGGCEAITDCDTFAEAEVVARYLSSLSGLILAINC
jgi:hypothetical protein